jgi:hypothetical protein
MLNSLSQKRRQEPDKPATEVNGWRREGPEMANPAETDEDLRRPSHAGIRPLRSSLPFLGKDLPKGARK